MASAPYYSGHFAFTADSFKKLQEPLLFLTILQ
jgi:hypothetical protein